MHLKSIRSIRPESPPLTKNEIFGKIFLYDFDLFSINRSSLSSDNINEHFTEYFAL